VKSKIAIGTGDAFEWQHRSVTVHLNPVEHGNRLLTTIVGSLVWSHRKRIQGSLPGASTNDVPSTLSEPV